MSEQRAALSSIDWRGEASETMRRPASDTLGRCGPKTCSCLSCAKQRLSIDGDAAAICGRGSDSMAQIPTWPEDVLMLRLSCEQISNDAVSEATCRRGDACSARSA